MDVTPQSILAEGTYGCTFYPPITCSKSKQKAERNAKRSKKVGKITRQSDANYELDISRALSQKAGYEDYFAVQVAEDCSRADYEKIKRDYEEDCDFLKHTKTSELAYIIAPYAGIPLRQYPITQTFPLLGFMKHCLEGVQRMHELGYGHFDIHEMNILIDSKGTARFIDFGKSMKGDEVDAIKIRKHTFSFTPGFVWQPPELSVMNGIQNGMSQQSAIARTIEKKSVFRDIQNYLGITRLAQHKELEDFITYSESAQRGEWDRFFRHYWRTFDVWALGVVYIHVLKYLLVNPRFITDSWTQIGSRVRLVLKGMLHADPRKREKVEELLKHF
jgi:serine/threonine protein kinase